MPLCRAFGTEGWELGARRWRLRRWAGLWAAVSGGCWRWPPAREPRVRIRPPLYRRDRRRLAASLCGPLVACGRAATNVIAPAREALRFEDEELRSASDSLTRRAPRHYARMRRRKRTNKWWQRACWPGSLSPSNACLQRRHANTTGTSTRSSRRCRSALAPPGTLTLSGRAGQCRSPAARLRQLAERSSSSGSPSRRACEPRRTTCPQGSASRG